LNKLQKEKLFNKTDVFKQKLQILYEYLRLRLFYTWWWSKEEMKSIARYNVEIKVRQ